MLVNKWYLAGLSLLAALIAWAAAFDWTTLFSAREAGAIVGAIATLKFVLNLLMPPASQSISKVPGATAASVVTHT